ncbi:beta-1,6-N-acetylglucosaminyltransferase [Pedobacter sp.]|uniref:beta-1,6-N-acetylglucosaminyltransferase n=1 Tax=Pedobacter sp. TaxID=1411316 RepID=UPI003BABB06A
MAYKNPMQLERLLKSMEHPDFYLFIHLDLKIEKADFQYLVNLPRTYFINNRVLCNWGGFSFVKAILSSLSEVLDSDLKFDFINLMSAQDYPIKPINQIHNFLNQNKNKCFVSYDDDPEKKWWNHASKRSELYHLTDLNFKGRYFLQNFINKFLPKRNFPLSIELYGSSDSSWWTITSDCATYIVNFMEQNKELYKFMKYTWGADEFLIATIIMNSPFRSIVVNNNLRLIKWQDGLANPMILTIEDLPMIKNSDKLFSRKFDDKVDEKILNELDKYLHVD